MHACQHQATHSPVNSAVNDVCHDFSPNLAQRRRPHETAPPCISGCDGTGITFSQLALVLVTGAFVAPFTPYNPHRPSSRSLRKREPLHPDAEKPHGLLLWTSSSIVRATKELSASSPKPQSPKPLCHQKSEPYDLKP